MYQARARSRIVAVATAAGACVAALLVAVATTPAEAGTTTVTPNEPGTPPVVRESSVTVKLDVGAQHYYRSAGSAAKVADTAFAPLTVGGLAFVAAVGRACLGNNPAPPASNVKNNSPRDTITVKGPGGDVIHTEASKARDWATLSGIANGGPVLSPQPAPGNNNYIGDFPATQNGPHGLSFTLSLLGRPAGVYTVTTVTQHMVKSDTTFSPGACTIGRPDPANPKLVIPGPVTETVTFEYRPWQHEFVDVFGNGGVTLNLNPAEGRWKVNGAFSQIWSGPTYLQQTYSLPGASDFMLPSDPAACVTDPASCLPSTAVPCDPSTACVPRLVLINKPKADGQEFLAGVFDLQTKAFIAWAGVGLKRQVLTSLGTVLDAKYKATLAQLAAAAATQNIDLMSLLATQVRLRPGFGQTMSLSLLNGLQHSGSLTDKGGFQIVSDTTIQAGVILDIYLGLVPNQCVTASANSADGATGYTSTSGAGYTVKKSPLLPKVPAVGPLGAVVGGTVWSIKGVFPAAGALANTASALVGIDTAAGEPTGYPVWINPFVSGMNVGSPKKMDFLGTATWVAAETSLGESGCFVSDLMLGTGVAVYNSPVGVDLQDLPVLWDDNATAADLVAQIDAALQKAVDSVASNAAVDGVLGQILGLLPLGN